MTVSIDNDKPVKTQATPNRFKRHLLCLMLCGALPISAADLQQNHMHLSGYEFVVGSPEDEFEDEIEEEVEDEIEDEIEDSIDEELEEELDEELDEQLEEELDEGIEEELEEDIEQDMEDQIEDNFEEDLEDNFEEDLEENFEEEMEENFEHEMEEHIEEDFEESLEPEIADSLEQKLEQTFEEDFAEEYEEDIFFEVVDDPEAFFDEQIDEELIDEEQWEEEFEEDWEEAFEWEHEGEIDHVMENAIEQVVEMVDTATTDAVKRQEQEIWTENWLIFSDPQIQQQLESLGYRYVRNQRLGALGKTLSTVVAPASFSLQNDYLMVLKQLNKATMYADLNHIYRHQSAPPPPSHQGKMPSDVMGLNISGRSLEIGMIDTDINTAHEALQNSDIVRKSFVEGSKKVPKRHGTQIAGILVGNSASYRGLLPESKLLGASVFFHQKGKGNIATTESLLMALNWLAEQKVKVINMSLSGPANRLLEFAVNELCRQNIAIVAAVGNAGPLSKPLYPAGYQCTVAVTAVDDNKRIYKNAVMGKHVDLAAFGVDLKTPGLKQSYRNASGTSMATAFVSAYIATLGKPPEPEQTPLERWLDNLYRTCQDLGAKGRDPVFGHGLLPISNRQTEI